MTLNVYEEIDITPEGDTFYQAVEKCKNNWETVDSDTLVGADDSGVDQGDNSITGTLAWHVAQTTKTVIPQPGTYTISTNITMPAGMYLDPDNDAIFKPALGKTLTVYSPEHIIASSRQKIIDTTNNSTNPLKFTKPGVVYLEWWGAVVDDGTDDSTYANCALQSFPITTAPVGGKIKLHHGTYRADSSWIFPVNGTAEIRGIEIEGTGGSLGAGGATNPYGTRIDSYIDGGILFDLQTANADSVNIRLSNLTAYDREGTGANYGFHAYKFTSGCVLENVGFKAFTTGVYIETFAYYAKLENVKSYYHRGWGIQIEGANQCLLSRVTASNGSSAAHGGLYLTASGTHLRGVTVMASYFEGNTGDGVNVATSGSHHGYAVNFIGNYFEGNGADKADLTISGADSTYRVHSGVIHGNIFEQGAGGADHVAISLGYVSNLNITGNTLNVYKNSRTIYSTGAQDCFVANNFQHASATVGIEIPEDNTVLDEINKLGVRVSGSPIPGNGVYDFAVDTGAIASYVLGTIPDNARITRAWYQSITDPTSDGAATIEIGVSSDDSNGIMVATAFDNAAWNPGYHDAVPDKTAANFTVQTTAKRNVIFTIAGAVLTAGKFKIWWEYVVGE